MATVTLGVTTGSTSNAGSYAAAAITPAAGDLLVVLINATGTVATNNGNGGSITDTQNLGWTKLVGSGYNGNADTYAAFVANNSAANSTETVTWSCSGDNGTGAVVTVYRISGAGGFPGVRQVGFASGAAAATPTVVMSTAILTGNPCVGFGCNGGAANSLTNPTGFTESPEVAFTSPAGNQGPIFANSGVTDSTVTWGASSATAWGAVVIELYNTGTGATPDNSVGGGYYGNTLGA